MESAAHVGLAKTLAFNAACQQRRTPGPEPEAAGPYCAKAERRKVSMRYPAMWLKGGSSSE